MKYVYFIHAKLRRRGLLGLLSTQTIRFVAFFETPVPEERAVDQMHKSAASEGFLVVKIDRVIAMDPNDLAWVVHG